MRDCSGALGLPSTMPAEPLVGSLLLPGCTLSTLRPRPHGLVSLRCPVPKASPCPFPTDPPPPALGSCCHRRGPDTQVLLCHYPLQRLQA